MEYNSDSDRNLDFFHNDAWPMELRLLVSEHLAPKDLLSCRVVCKTWHDRLKDELFWKAKIPSGFGSYSWNVNGEYYRLFTRGGVHLIQVYEHLKKFMVEDHKAKTKDMPLHKGKIAQDLGFCYTKTINYFNEAARLYMINIMDIDCPYIAKPTKIFFIAQIHDYLVFDNEIEHICDVITEEEYSEKFVIEMFRQLMQTTEYWENFSGFAFRIRRTYDGNIRLQLIPNVEQLHYAPFLISSEYYKSPEEIRGIRGYDPKPCVVFSLGALLVCFLTGRPMFDAPSVQSLGCIRRMETYEVKDPYNELTDLAKDFVNRLVKKSPEDRMTMEQALAHPWLTNPHPSTSPLKTAYALLKT